MTLIWLFLRTALSCGWGCTCQHHASCLPVHCPQAIAAGHAAAVAALVSGGLDPNSRLPDSGLSLLEAAAHHGRGEVITALIRGGLSGGCWRPLASTSAGDLLPDSCGFLSVVVCMPLDISKKHLVAAQPPHPSSAHLS